MRIVYICSPYRAADEETLHRNIEYARELTREALLRGESPVTVHLYMTQCLNETDRQERETGLAAGREIIPRYEQETSSRLRYIHSSRKWMKYLRRVGVSKRTMTRLKGI